MCLGTARVQLDGTPIALGNAVLVLHDVVSGMVYRTLG